MHLFSAGGKMAGIGKLSALHALLLAFAFTVALDAGPVSAQIVPPTPPGCLSDPRFVRVLGVWQGQPVCEFTGGGTGEDGGMPMRTAKCLADHGQVVVFNGYSYCVWYHGGDQALLAAIIYDPGTTPLPPDDIMFPAQLNSREETSNPNHCTRGPHFIRTLGRSRGVTLCQWSLPPVLDSDCPSSNNSNGRVRVFPTDLVNTPAPDTSRSPPNLPGTRYCVTTPASRQNRVPAQSARHSFWRPPPRLAQPLGQFRRARRHHGSATEPFRPRHGCPSRPPVAAGGRPFHAYDLDRQHPANSRRLRAGRARVLDPRSEERRVGKECRSR